MSIPVPRITCKHKLPTNKPFKASIVVGWEKNFNLLKSNKGDIIITNKRNEF